MAVDVCSEVSSLVTSPRISFSHDLNQTDDTVPIECHHRRSDALLLEFSSDFDFCVSSHSYVQELSSADELFSNGKILPTQIKKVKNKKEIHQSERPQPCKIKSVAAGAFHSENTNEDTKKKRLKEFLFDSEEDEQEKPSPSKSFWQFKRSASLNCENGRSKGLLRSLQSLARSNSTGSAPTTKQTVAPKVSSSVHNNSQKHPTFTRSNSSASSFNGYNSWRRPPLTKNCRPYGNGVTISPVLNIPPAYISKGTASLFGFGSFFCNGKSKNKKK